VLYWRANDNEMVLIQVRGHLDAGSDGKLRVQLPIGDDISVSDIHKMCTTDSSSCSQPREACTDVFLLEHGYYHDEPASKLLLVPRTGTVLLLLGTF